MGMTHPLTPAQAFALQLGMVMLRLNRLYAFANANFDCQPEPGAPITWALGAPITWAEVADVAQIAAVLKLACDLAFSEGECET